MFSRQTADQRLVRPLDQEALVLFRSRMTLDTLEHRDVTQVNRVFERLVRLVTGFAFGLTVAAKF